MRDHIVWLHQIKRSKLLHSFCHNRCNTNVQIVPTHLGMAFCIARAKYLFSTRLAALMMMRVVLALVGTA